MAEANLFNQNVVAEEEYFDDCLTPNQFILGVLVILAVMVVVLAVTTYILFQQHQDIEQMLQSLEQGIQHEWISEENAFQVCSQAVENQDDAEDNMESEVAIPTESLTPEPTTTEEPRIVPTATETETIAVSTEAEGQAEVIPSEAVLSSTVESNATANSPISSEDSEFPASTFTATDTPTIALTSTPTTTDTPTNTPTATDTPSSTPTSTATPLPTATDTETPEISEEPASRMCLDDGPPTEIQPDFSRLWGDEWTSSQITGSPGTVHLNDCFAIAHLNGEWGYAVWRSPSDSHNPEWEIGNRSYGLGAGETIHSVALYIPPENLDANPFYAVMYEVSDGLIHIIGINREGEISLNGTSLGLSAVDNGVDSVSLEIVESQSWSSLCIVDDDGDVIYCYMPESREWRADYTFRNHETE